MNAEAKRLGLAEHAFHERDRAVRSRSTTRPPRDLARLAAALIRDYPEYYPLYSQKEFRYNNITQPNRNRLLWIDPYVDGMKTGHTERRGLVPDRLGEARRAPAAVGGAGRELGRRARERERRSCSTGASRRSTRSQLYQSGKPVSTLRVWKGAATERAGGFLADRYLTLPKGKADKLALTMAAHGAAGRAGGAGRSASARSRSRWKASRSPSFR